MLYVLTAWRARARVCITVLCSDRKGPSAVDENAFLSLRDDNFKLKKAAAAAAVRRLSKTNSCIVYVCGVRLDFFMLRPRARRRRRAA